MRNASSVILKSSLLALAISLVACGNSETPAPTPPADAPAATAATPAPAPVADAASEGEVKGFESQLQSVLAMAHRSEANKARDVYRHPAETLGFFGLTDNQTVIEITPGGGWYTEILAPLLREKGKYVTAIIDPAGVEQERAKEYYTKSNASFEEKLKLNPELYDKTEIKLFTLKTPSFGEPGSADMVLTFRNVHNWMGQGAEAAMFKGFFEVLKSGGKLGITEHRAAPGTDAKESAKSGYLAESVVIEMAKAAGFELVAQSEINANPLDTKDYEGGVWTLPPTLRLGDKDKEKYLAIGESDRMTLLFKKP